MKNSICLATNYLKLTDSVRRMWIEFDRHLAEAGGRLVLLSVVEPGTPLPFPVISIPLSLRDYARQYPAACPEGGTVSAGDMDLLELESRRMQGVHAPADALAGLMACRQVFRSVLQTIQPGYVLTWDSTSPMAVILRGLCDEAGIPVQCLERGLLPETLMVESRGLQAQSDLRTHWLAQEIPASAWEPRAYQEIRDYYLANKPQKYDQPNFGQGGQALRAQLKLGNRRVVVFFGQFDPCSQAPGQGQSRRYQSAEFNSTPHALSALLETVQQDPQLALVFKPHPIDNGAYTVAAGEGVHVVRDANVHALMDLADVVVTQFTTLQFETPFYDKPVLLLSPSAWWGRNAAYEVNDRADLQVQLRSALNREGWAERSANGRAFITWIMEQFLIGHTPEVPARRKLRDFAAYIARTALDAVRLPGSETRWLSAQTALQQLKQGKTPASLPPMSLDESLSRRLPEVTSKTAVADPIAAVPAQPAPRKKSPFELVLDSSENGIPPKAKTGGCGSKAKTPCDSQAESLPIDFETLHKRHDREPANAPAAPSPSPAPAKSVLQPLAQVLAFNSLSTCFTGVRIELLPPTLRSSVNASLQSQDLDGVIALLRVALEKETKNPVLWDALGEATWQARQFEAARDAFTQSAYNNPTSVATWVKLGVTHRELKQLPESAAALQQAMQLDGKNAGMLRETAITRILQKRYDEASKVLDRALSVDANDVRSLLLSARCQFELGDQVAARLKYLQVVKLDANNIEAKEALRLLNGPDQTVALNATEKTLIACEAARPFKPTKEMLEREYPCPYAFNQLYMVPRTKLDLRFCSYHGPVLFDDQKAVYERGLDGLDQISHGHPQFVQRRERYLAGDYKGAGCSENCIWYNKWKTTGKGFKLADHLGPDGFFKVGKIWLSMGPDCNVTCRYCLEPGEFKMDYNTCDPAVMNVARDFVRRGGELLLTGGETFLPKWGFARILEELVNWGDAKGSISMHTNGTYLNEKNRDLLLRGPMVTVGISMDTLRKDLYEYLRRGTSYDQVWNNVTSLVRERNARGQKKPSVILLAAMMKSTATHVVETVDRAVEAGLGISLNALFQAYYSPEFSAKEGLHNLTPAELDKLYADVLHIEKKYGATGPVHYQGFKGQVENQLQLVKSGSGERQVVLGGGGQTPRLPHFEQVGQAEQLVAQGKFEEARAIVEPLLKLINRSIRGQRCWASILAGLNRTEEAIKVYQLVMKLDPRDTESQAILDGLENKTVLVPAAVPPPVFHATQKRRSPFELDFSSEKARQTDLSAS